MNNVPWSLNPNAESCIPPQANRTPCGFLGSSSYSPEYREHVMKEFNLHLRYLQEKFPIVLHECLVDVFILKNCDIDDTSQYLDDRGMPSKTVDISAWLSHALGNGDVPKSTSTDSSAHNSNLGAGGS